MLHVPADCSLTLLKTSQILKNLLLIFSILTCSSSTFENWTSTPTVKQPVGVLHVPADCSLTLLKTSQILKNLLLIFSILTCSSSTFENWTSTPNTGDVLPPMLSWTVDGSFAIPSGRSENLKNSLGTRFIVVCLISIWKQGAKIETSLGRLKLHKI